MQVTDELELTDRADESAAASSAAAPHAAAAFASSALGLAFALARMTWESIGAVPLGVFRSVRRGVYGGTVGYFDFAGDMDMAIAIRTAVLKDGTAHVQAGGGVVADSVPTMEHRETQSKAAAALRAVASAETLRPA